MLVQALTDRSLEEAPSEGPTPHADAADLPICQHRVSDPVAHTLRPEYISHDTHAGPLQQPHSRGHAEHEAHADQPGAVGETDGVEASSTDSTQSSPRKDPKPPQTQLALPESRAGQPDDEAASNLNFSRQSATDPQPANQPAPGAAAAAEDATERGGDGEYNLYSGPRPRPGRRRSSSEERRLSGQSPHSMWEHMPIASVPELQVSR